MIQWLCSRKASKDEPGTGWAKHLLEIQRPPQLPATHIGVVVDKLNSAMSSRIVVQMPANAQGLHRLVEITERYTNIFDVIEIGHKVGFQWEGDKAVFVGVVDDLTER